MTRTEPVCPICKDVIRETQRSAPYHVRDPRFTWSEKRFVVVAAHIGCLPPGDPDTDEGEAAA